MFVCVCLDVAGGAKLEATHVALVRRDDATAKLVVVILFDEDEAVEKG